MGSEQYLKASNLECGAGNFSVSEVNFYLESGEIMGLVGRSGSGKSTVIKTLLGIYPVRGGSIVTNNPGLPVNEIVGYSSQSNSLNPNLSIEENIKLFGELRDMESEDIHSRKSRLLEEFEISEAKDKLVSELSGGMKKRADLCVALLHDPEVVILDEPFVGIDPPQRDAIWNIIHRESQRGRMFIITSHMLQNLSDNCGKLGLVHQNKFYNQTEVFKMMSDHDYENLERFLKDIFRI